MTTTDIRQLLSGLPPVDRVLLDPAAAPLLDVYGRNAVTNAIRDAIGTLRQAVLAGTTNVLREVGADEGELRKVHRMELVEVYKPENQGPT